MPLTEPRQIAVFISSVIAGLVGSFALFRSARRPTCTWARPWRLLAQAPGWLLVALGVYLVAGLALLEWREGRLGLGTGVVVAVLFATIKGVSMAMQNARQG